MTARDFFERYGVTLGVIAALIIIIAVLPGNAVKNTAGQITDNSGSGTSTNGGSLEPGASVDDLTPGSGSSGGGGGGGSSVPGGGGGGSGSTQPGKAPVGQAVFGKGLCRSDGRQSGISLLMPPCAVLQGKNGGATYRGVSSNKIVVVRYIGQQDPGTQAILQSASLSDPEDVRANTYNAFLKYSNQHYQTYGREVVFKIVNASGKPDNDEAMKADAVKIANDIKAFAVIEGSPDQPIPKILAQELSHRGVICICTVSLSRQFYASNPPYMWSSLPTSDEYAENIGEYIGKRLKGKKAQWAGDDILPSQGFRKQTRKFGLIYIEGANGVVDPEGKRAADQIVAQLKKYGVTLAAKAAYIYEGGTNTDVISGLVTSMKNAHVTTVLTLTDPLYPILISREATNQSYYPEWFITGSGLTDTTAAGRLYDQLQWRHAFGISPLWVTWSSVAKSGPDRIYHHGFPNTTEKPGVLAPIYASYFGILFTGLQMAGPLLTADSFAVGMTKFPKTGGIPASPLVQWTRQDPTAIKDFTEVWYSYTAKGIDERGKSGTGMLFKVDQGKRYLPGQWPTTNPKAFITANALATSDNPPGGGDPPHEQDGHTHVGACMSCPGFKTIKK